MPGTLAERHVLNDLAVAPNQHMRGNATRRNRREVRVRIRRQISREKPVDPGPAKIAGRQADPMNEDEIRRDAPRPWLVVRGEDLPSADGQARGGIDTQDLRVSG